MSSCTEKYGLLDSLDHSCVGEVEMVGNVEVGPEVDEDFEVANAGYIEVEFARTIVSADVAFEQWFLIAANDNVHVALLDSFVDTHDRAESAILAVETISQ